MSMEIEIVKEVEVDRWEKPVTITLREYYTMKDQIKRIGDRVGTLSDIIDELHDTMDDIYEVTYDYTNCDEAMLKIGRMTRGAEQ